MCNINLYKTQQPAPTGSYGNHNGNEVQFSILCSCITIPYVSNSKLFIITSRTPTGEKMQWSESSERRVVIPDESILLQSKETELKKCQEISDGHTLKD